MGGGVKSKRGALSSAEEGGALCRGAAVGGGAGAAEWGSRLGWAREPLSKTFTSLPTTA